MKPTCSCTDDSSVSIASGAVTVTNSPNSSLPNARHNMSAAAFSSV